ncbi:MAG TPA: carboxypeptidase-like regulatory domain-containing protein [Kofleriaceae bacterium]|nr:carboxypeptidase-like regulatory domain-containing protein [Kofleriaceae bacterium]
MLPRGLAALAVVAALAGTARAQEATDQLGIERFRIAIDRAGILDVEWAGVPGHLSWGAGVLVGFAHDPLVVYDRAMSAVDALVDRRLTTTVVGSIALWNRLQLGLTVDIVGYQSGEDVLATMGALPTSGLGDMRLLAKLLIAGDARYQLALIPALTVPAGEARGYLRESGAAFAPALAASVRSGRVRGALNLGYAIKPRVEAAGLVSDDEAFARLGAGVTLGAPAAPAAELWLATSIATPLTDAAHNQVAIELLAGAARRFTPTLEGFIGGGIGLDNGFGTPDWRALAGVRFEVASGDRDRDGVASEADRCPDEPEDRDGFADSDGCPDPDNDGDGVADARDRCANEVEDNDGFQDDDGCADRDNDGDGVADAQDRCPDKPEDKDGFQDDDGCPDDIARVDGVVVDPDGRPLAGAKISIVQYAKPSAAPIELTAGDDGKFSTQLDGGALDVTASAAEYKTGTTSATVEPGTHADVTVKLVRAVRQGQLRGQVLSFNGKPLAATITVRGKTTTSATTDADGQFTIELPEGPFSVEIASPGFVTQKRNVTIKLDGVTVLNVDLRGGS